jgi:hypothetical protein
MYSGFNYSINDVNKFSHYFYQGKEIFDNHKEIIKREINNYLINGILDGTMIQKVWFKDDIKADIFISHSHNDESLAIGLAGWLYEKFEITSFIDSCVWGNSTDLLRDIDEQYSKMDGNPNVFDYYKRNYSTSHVHMMLQTALYKMIDNVESVFVLNTNNSFDTIETVKNTIKNKTSSPWIYSEIIATTIMRKKSLEEYRRNIILEQRDFSEVNNSLNVKYDIDLDHLIKIDDSILDEWKIKRDNEDISSSKKYNYGREIKSLDYLYDLVERKRTNKK